MGNIVKVAGKEYNSFFASPAAWLFLGIFIISTLFIFFWAEPFFARNLADLKPLFQWMPILLILLVSALTMRSWSEERRSGTLESLLTSPVRPIHLVLGKFLASLGLVALALALTLPLAISVSMMGDLDWGPVLGGYLASLVLAAAYIAIGLYMSARTDNPIVALILTVAVSGIFYLLGSSLLTSLFGHSFASFLELLGSGSRFDSITRGVLDIRDIYYYLSIVGVFLTLNLFTLERLRWVGNTKQAAHKQWYWVIALVVVNFIAANFWLNGVTSARADLTQGKLYSLSDSTRQYMGQLQEPLLIRGYFSSKSHPLLEPLVPQIHDLLKEYQVAGGNKVNVEFVDPHNNQELEEEAANKYGVRPMPFRMASRYTSGVVNSYFDLIVAYGDQYEKLTFENLIEIKSDQATGDLDVLLNNPEYAITRAIRKVANAYQAGGNVFASLDKPVTFKGYMSPKANLPGELADLRSDLESVLDELKQSADGKFEVSFEDPQANGGQLGQQLEEAFGFGPQIASLFDPQPFWFYMMLDKGGNSSQIPLPEGLDKASLKKAIESAVQRLSPGVLKTIALVEPEPPAQQPPMMQQFAPPPPRGNTYRALRETLEENARIIETDLKSGTVPAETDLLLVLAPSNLSEKQVFAIDQFMMRGGTVIMATSPFNVSISQTLEASKQTSGLEQWLVAQGIDIDETMVLDPQNAALPVPVTRQVGMMSLEEIQMMPYPHFPDLRSEGLSADNAITSGLGQITLNWASPIDIDADKNKDRTVETLLHSSANSWISDVLNVLPDYERYEDGFKDSNERQSEVLAVAVKGRFDSYFKGKQSPLLAKKEANDEADESPEANINAADENDAADEEDKQPSINSVIERSPESSRLIVISSNTFADDSVLQLASQGMGTQYVQPISLIQNAIDWSLEDQGLLSMRSRSQFARTLNPMSHGAQLFWEYLNYLLALAGLALIWFVRKLKRAKTQAHYNTLLAEV